MTDETTVFIVDDDAAVLDSLQVLLATLGYRVKPFDSGRAFLDGYDPRERGCLVLDIRMPGMTGLELLDILQQRYARIPCIMMTAHGDIRMAVQAMKLGAVDFIEKPFRAEQILDSIRNALEHDVLQRAEGQAADALRENVARLTDREREVFREMIKGSVNKVIAAELHISPRTVEIHRARVLEKLEVRNLSHLIRLAMLAGLD